MVHRALVYAAVFALFGLRPSVEEWLVKTFVRTTLLLLLAQPELWKVAALGGLVSLAETQEREAEPLVRTAAAGACVALLAVFAADYFGNISFLSVASFCLG